MLLGGDEFRRSQRGNNNAYCQDNELTWYDWHLIDQNGELLRFTREMIALRKRHPVLTTESFYGVEDVSWFDASGNTPDWGSGERSLGCVLHGNHFDDVALCLLFNAESHEVELYLPEPCKGQDWRLAVNSAARSHDDVNTADDAPLIDASSALMLEDHSLMVLVGQSR